MFLRVIGILGQLALLAMGAIVVLTAIVQIIALFIPGVWGGLTADDSPSLLGS